jgi:hypothetical protein
MFISFRYVTTNRNLFYRLGLNTVHTAPPEKSHADVEIPGDGNQSTVLALLIRVLDKLNIMSQRPENINNAELSTTISLLSGMIEEIAESNVGEIVITRGTSLYQPTPMCLEQVIDLTCCTNTINTIGASMNLRRLILPRFLHEFDTETVLKMSQPGCSSYSDQENVSTSAGSSHDEAKGNENVDNSDEESSLAQIKEWCRREVYKLCGYNSEEEFHEEQRQEQPTVVNHGNLNFFLICAQWFLAYAFITAQHLNSTDEEEQDEKK